MDYFYSDHDVTVVQATLPFPAPDLVAQSVSDPWWVLSGHRNRVSFCTQCALEDLHRTRIPVWRRRWSHWWYVICDNHHYAMRSLTGPYRVLNVLDRATAASRLVIDKQVEIESENRRYHGTIYIPDLGQSLVRGGTAFSHMQTALDAFGEMAWLVQNDIAFFYRDHYLEAAPERVVMILDLVRLLLRRHIRGVDAPPYAYQLFNIFYWRPDYQYHSGESESPDVIFDRVEETLDSLLRLVAFSIVSVLFNYPGANSLWRIIVESGARIGALIPDTVGWLYASISGPIDSPARQWYSERVASYSGSAQDQCREFIDAPLSFQRITKQVSDLL